MRLIKFRAWCTNQKIWLHQEEENTTVKEILDLFKSLNHEEKCYKDTVILEQFTGLKDKNGVDVYEGDIVLAPITVEVPFESKDFSYFNTDEDGNRTKMCCKLKPSVVEYDKSGYSFKHSSGKTKPFWICHSDIESKYEVIGNIHQNQTK